MKNAEALKLAKLALMEIRLLLRQQKFAAAAEMAEIGFVIPEDEDNLIMEGVVYERLFEYVTKYPERQQLTHINSTIRGLKGPSPRAIAKTA